MPVLLGLNGKPRFTQGSDCCFPGLNSQMLTLGTNSWRVFTLAPIFLWYVILVMITFFVGSLTVHRSLSSVQAPRQRYLRLWFLSGM